MASTGHLRAQSVQPFGVQNGIEGTNPAAYAAIDADGCLDVMKFLAYTGDGFNRAFTRAERAALWGSKWHRRHKPGRIRRNRCRWLPRCDEVPCVHRRWLQPGIYARRACSPVGFKMASKAQTRPHTPQSMQMAASM